MVRRRSASAKAPGWGFLPTAVGSCRSPQYWSSETLVLLPTGPGQPRSLTHKGILSIPSGGFLPDGKRVLFAGRAGSDALRLYVQNLEGGEPRAISSEGMQSGYVSFSPDGRFVAARGPDSKIAIYPVDGGAPRPLAGFETGESPILWSADGGSLYAYRRGEAPAQVFKSRCRDRPSGALEDDCARGSLGTGLDRLHRYDP